MLNAHDAPRPPFSLYDNALMTIRLKRRGSSRGSRGHPATVQSHASLDGQHADAARDLSGWHRAGRADERCRTRVAKYPLGMPGPQFGGGAITNIRNTKSAHLATMVETCVGC